MTEAEIAAASSGVAFTPPPADLLPAVNGSISAALASLKPGSKGALVAIATQTGINAAIVSVLPPGFAVHAYIGKQWGEPGATFGAAIRREW